MAIRVLPPRVASLIAAGEVIERPASVVRELIENALDGGAKTVDISVPYSNFSRIVVEDDGVGMSEDDLALACLHHTTSKLKDDSIQFISTLGFRGEALASIAAVAAVFITSRVADGIAFRVSAKHGKVYETAPTSGSFGTRVVVEHLFEAHPARLAFMKSFNRELALVEDVIERCALAWPGVKFVFRKVNKTRIIKPASNIMDRIRDVRGGFFKSDSVTICHEKEGVSVEGLTCLPTVMDASQKGSIDIIVNGRLVSDRALSAVIHSVYRNLTGKDHRAFCAVSITVSPFDVNLNVHPTKAEVRFRDPGKIAEVLRTAVDSALSSSGLKSRSSLKGLANKLSEPAIPADDSRRKPLGRFLGQANQSWLIAETIEGIVIIDQHAAHERVILERLKKAAANFPGELFFREMPYRDNVTLEQAASIEEMRPLLEEAGFRISVNGKEVSLNAYPAVLSDCSPGDIVALLADHCETGSVSGLMGDALWEQLATAACKAAIKAGHKLSPERADALLREIEQTPNASYCNHGRPTIKFLSMSDIGKLFER
jgi:DNA mismatch repair protein MutL